MLDVMLLYNFGVDFVIIWQTFTYSKISVLFRLKGTVSKEPCSIRFLIKLLPSGYSKDTLG